MAQLLDRISIDPAVCGGRPCIRGTRLRVIDVLDLLASGMTQAEILLDYPHLGADDLTASLLYASMRVEHTTATT